MNNKLPQNIHLAFIFTRLKSYYYNYVSQTCRPRLYDIMLLYKLCAIRN